MQFSVGNLLYQVINTTEQRNRRVMAGSLQPGVKVLLELGMMSFFSFPVPGLACRWLC